MYFLYNNQSSLLLSVKFNILKRSLSCMILTEIEESMSY